MIRVLLVEGDQDRRAALTRALGTVDGDAGLHELAGAIFDAVTCA